MSFFNLFHVQFSVRKTRTSRKLYDEETIKQGLDLIPFITRIPGTIKLEKTTIESALQKPVEEWTLLDEKHRFQTFNLEHYGLQQRWIVIHSEERQDKAEKSVEVMYKKELEKIKKTLKKLSAEEFLCPHDARGTLKRYFAKSKFYEVLEGPVEEEKKYESKGRPKLGSPYKLVYHITGVVQERQGVRQEAIRQSSCFVLGTTILEKDLSDADVIMAYKNQNNTVERGFRFLKDPLMFTSSLFVKKPERIMGLLMVMTLALLVYSIAQRRLHKVLKEVQETLPNQIRKETAKPTLRWIFQLLDGIELVKMNIKKALHVVFSGLTPLRRRILGYFGSSVRKIYGLDLQPAPIT